jgi:hypothetical protein
LTQFSAGEELEFVFEPTLRDEFVRKSVTATRFSLSS